MVMYEFVHKSNFVAFGTCDGSANNRVAWKRRIGDTVFNPVCFVQRFMGDQK